MKKIKTIKDFRLKGKRVLLRCDFNVPSDKQGFIEDDFRIKQTIPTIEYLLEQGAEAVLMSHLSDEGASLKPIKERLEQILNRPIIFAEDYKKPLGPGNLFLLENLRINKGEEENNKEFAKELSKLGDIYINDSFGVCHREHASIVAITEYLPSGAGLLLQKEIESLSRALSDPKRPLVFVVGGAKLSSKIKVINNFLKKGDKVLVGGKIANTILIMKKKLNRSTSEEINQKIKLNSKKLILPVDVIASDDEVNAHSVFIEKAGGEEMLLDIGPQTIENFKSIIKTAKTIVWAGPLGYFENPLFERGTKAIASEIADSRAFKIVGGGDTLNALAKYNLREKFDHISTGGGAMLAFLAGEKLPGIEALCQKK